MATLTTSPTTETGASAPATNPAPAAARPVRGRPVHVTSIAVGIAGAVIVAALTWITGVVNSHTQSHLLHVQTAAAGLVLQEVIPTVRTPLTTAVAVADASNGDVGDVRNYLASEVGTQPGKLFLSLSLWRLSSSGTGRPVRLLLLGRHYADESGPAAIAPALSHLSAPEVLTVRDLLGETPPRIGYAVESVGTSPRYVVFAEAGLPPHRRATVPASSAFKGLNFALYLGSRPVRSHLLEATAPAPVPGPLASVRIPFGTSRLDFVASAKRPLGGGVLPVLPWIIGGAGALLVAGAVVMTEWLMRRRRLAEHLARENHRLYAEQRSIAQTLQRALLPKHLPEVPGVSVAARYVPGDAAADVGGDWYDLIRCDNRSFIFAVGDVSGRGVAAANTMASLHYAIRAYAAQGDDAETILNKLTALLDVGRDGHFATVLLGHVDVPDHELTIVNAGHLPPLIVSTDGAEYVQAVPGAPIGIGETVRYVPITVRVPAGASVLAYTDGLVERRGEHLDTGLERLREIASSDPPGPELLLDRILSALTIEASDDVAMLAMRWAK